MTNPIPAQRTDPMPPFHWHAIRYGARG
jgi:hypothetical protein